jgi:outer membrane protein assembly factor BamB
MHAAAIFLILASAVLAETNWPQFRGPNASGVAEDAKPPAEFAADKIVAWKATIGPGISSPVVAGERVFITGMEDGKPHMLCLLRADGGQVWKAAVPAAKAETVHKTSHPVSATPATDGQRVVGWFPAFGLMAWDMNGKELWRKELEMPFVVNGSGTSPILADDKVILACDQQGGKSFLLAADAATGKTVWQTLRPLAVSSYTTPVIWKRGGVEEVVVSGSLKVSGYSLADGAERWTARGTEAVSVCPTPVLGDGMCYIMSRSFGEQPPPAGLEGLLLVADKDKSGGLSREETPFFQKDGIYDFIDSSRDGSITADELKATTAHMQGADFGLLALRDPGKAGGDISGTHTAWKHQQGTAKVASPLLYRDRLWVVADGGLLTCTEPKTGKVIFERQRLGKEGGGDYYASPVAADGRIFLCSTRGVVTVIEAADSLKILHQTNLGAPILATPALSGGLLLIRSGTTLWAFGK